MKEQGKKSYFFLPLTFPLRLISNTNEEFRSQSKGKELGTLKCLHNKHLLTAKVLFFLITCTLQTTYTLLHDQIQD